MGAVAALTLAFLGSGTAAIAQNSEGKNDLGTVWVLDESKAQVDGDRTFYPLPDEAKGATVMTQELAESLGIKETGKLNQAATDMVESLMTAPSEDGMSEIPARESSNGTTAINYWTAFAAYGNGNWGPWAKRNGSLAGHSDSTTWTPRWAMRPGSSIEGKVSAQAVGWYKGYQYGSYGYFSQVYNVGSVSGAVSVPWGPVLATPTFRGTTWVAVGDGGKFM
jgi:hypothetical protein